MDSDVRSMVEVVEEAMCASLTNWSSRVRPEGVSAHAAGAVVDAMVKLRNVASAVEVLFLERAMESPAYRDARGRPSDDVAARKTGRSAAGARRARQTSQAAQESAELRGAMGRGELSPEQAERIADVVRDNPGAVSNLIGKARTEDFKGLRDACDRAKAAGDPDPEGRRRRVHARRRLRHWTAEDGSRQGHWAMTAEAAAEVELVLDAFTDAEFARARTQGRREGHEAYRADALLAMARAARSGDGSVKVKRELVLRVDYAAFRRGRVEGEEVCEIRGIGPVPVSVAKEFIEDDAFLKGLLSSGRDVRLVKHFGRHIPAELRTALLDRDQTCTTPGCNRSKWIEHDHEWPSAQGGPVSIENLQGKCKAECHPAKTLADNAETRRLRRAGLLPTRPPDAAAPPTLVAAGRSGGDDRPKVRPEDRDWRNRIRRGLPPPEVGPFDDEGLAL